MQYANKEGPRGKDYGQIDDSPILNDNRKYLFLNERFQFTKSYCDFSGKRSLLGKKINKKYYLYTSHGEETVKADGYEPMKVIEVVVKGNKQVIFYSDSKGKVCFVLSKKHKILTPEMIMDKVEKLPMVRSFSFMLFSLLFFFGVLRLREYSYENINLSLGYQKTNNYKVHFLFPKKVRKKFSLRTGGLPLLIHAFWVRIPLKDIYQHYLESSEINVPIYVKVLNGKVNYYYNFKERTKDKYNKKHFIFNTRSVRVPSTDTEMYVRKSVTGQYVLVVSTFLSKFIILKEKLAYLITMIKPNKDIYDIYFEKFSQGASESGFELFKHAVGENSKSIYILDRDNSRYEQLKRAYPDNLFAKNSLKSFYFIFLAKSFISSDLVTHIQRRLYDNDSLLKRKILHNNNKVFLQHGVSLATDLFERGYYNKKVPIAPDYIIANSEFERNLFIEKSSYTAEDLIVTGLPNIDLYVQSRKQPKEEITFLLTWRPWDLTGKIEEGSYIHRYRQFLDLIRNQSFYHDKKVNVVLHPKANIILQEQFPDFYNENKDYFYDGDIKDALLKSKVLVSDYSSVTFMAFAGGCNTIFYWEDKEKAELEYGSPNILQDNNAFGDIVYEFHNLNRIIQENYKVDQKNEYIDRFEILVECTDGNNTANTHKALRNILEDAGSLAEAETKPNVIG